MKLHITEVLSKAFSWEVCHARNKIKTALVINQANKQVTIVRSQFSYSPVTAQTDVSRSFVFVCFAMNI